MAIHIEDRYNGEIQGHLEIITERDGVRKVEYSNVITYTAREIMRDFVFGDPLQIKLNFGDLGYDIHDPNDDWNNPPPATGTEVHLVHKLGEVPITDRHKIVYKGKHTALFSFLMDKDEYNGLTDFAEGTTRFVEIGLAVNDDRLFTKKNHPVIHKDAYTKVVVNYYLLF